MRKEYSTVERMLLSCIGWYFVVTNDNNYDEAYKSLNNLGIHDIKYIKKKRFSFNNKRKRDEVIVTLERPGLFIGSKGSTIEGIKETILKYNIEKIDPDFVIMLRESIIANFLYPVDYTDYGDEK